MNPDERKLLDRIANQVDENNTILRGIRRVQRFTTVYRILYWVLIIGLSLFYFFAATFFTKDKIRVGLRLSLVYLLGLLLSAYYLIPSFILRNSTLFEEKFKSVLDINQFVSIKDIIYSKSFKYLKKEK